MGIAIFVEQSDVRVRFTCCIVPCEALMIWGKKLEVYSSGGVLAGVLLAEL
jgi:hypothetical protein